MPKLTHKPEPTRSQMDSLRSLIAGTARPYVSGLAVSLDDWLCRFSNLSNIFPELQPTYDAVLHAIVLGGHGTVRVKTGINDTVLVVQWHTNCEGAPKRIEVCYLS